MTRSTRKRAPDYRAPSTHGPAAAVVLERMNVTSVPTPASTSKSTSPSASPSTSATTSMPAPLRVDAPVRADAADAPVRADAAVAASVADTFDVCHGALVWRALLVVNAGLVLAVFATSPGVLEALAVAGPVGLVGLIGTATWLAGVCAARTTLASTAPVPRRVALLAWGAAVGLVCAWVLAWATFVPLQPLKAVVGALAGAGFAAGLAAWIEQRARVLRPAHADARLAELQARIRPHFLFNTLNTATALVRVDPAGAEAMLEDLSDLFRAALAEARTAALGAELAVARQYLAIEQRRFGERMRIDFDLDPAADHAVVPSLLLQPLVENAVHHGVESLREGAWIRVRTRVVRGAATVEIENNVGGTTRAGSGMALANVRERLRLLHDLDGRFDARREGDRFVVRLGVPLERS
jgi:two-component system, LytTR family, sensor histidine kinase AlgZ